MYRPVNLIEVRAWEKTVGAISLDSSTGYYVFEYAPSWQAGGIELAPLTMPVKESIHIFPLLPEPTFRRLPAMLADAIPDDFGNALIDAWLAKAGVPKEAITPLDRLAYMGKRGMGALEFRPVRGPRHTKTTAVEISKLVISSREALAGSIKGDRDTQAAIMNLIQVGTSAGGARAKAVVAWNPDTNEIRSGQLPADPGFEHWLLKLDGVGEGHDLSTGKGYGRIEYAYYLMARAAGITISESRLLEENGRAHFMTRRFDRSNGTKLHLQTLCAMQHLDYRQRATHDYSQYFQTIKALNLPLTELAEAYRRMIFNVLAANCDDHTKNHSFLMDKTGEWHLAPAYDLTHSFNLAGEWTYQHLMSVNGKFRNINRSDFHTVGDRFLVPNYKGIIKSVSAAIKRWPEFAEAAGLPMREAERIQNDFIPTAERG